MATSPKPTWTEFSKKYDVESLKSAYRSYLQYVLMKDDLAASDQDRYQAFAYAIRERLIERWLHTQRTYHVSNAKRVYYLSMEFLIGRILDDSVLKLGICDEAREAARQLGLEYDALCDQEPDAGLGNGGLGRLAACFMDSLATLQIPTHGYGIKYEYGMFNQRITDGYQIETPDGWLQHGNPWLVESPAYSFTVRFYGELKEKTLPDGNSFTEWVNTEEVIALPTDLPVPGYGNVTVNTLRLWQSRSSKEFDLEYFNNADYIAACEKKVQHETISKVLYPNDETMHGKELRLRQEYFFVSASLQDIIRRFKIHNHDFSRFPDKVAIQLNDTHPAIAIAELMRLLIDHEGVRWDIAWEITKKTFAYTNHTIMPEAMERWSLKLMERVLPRPMQLIYEINLEFLNELERKYPGDLERRSRMSVIDEQGEKTVRMVSLCIIGSHSVNGVSAVHTELLKTRVLKDWYELYPEKFNNKTNGISPRAWLMKCNPKLSDLVTSEIGSDWMTTLSELKKLERLATDGSFQERWIRVKRSNKERLAREIRELTGESVNPDSLFDVQVKRLHEYKRQLLFAIFLASEYLRLRESNGGEGTVRTAIFGGKAAPGYRVAKLIIKFINSLSETVNRDPRTRDQLKVIFLPNYRVSLAEKIIPAANLSEQISTAGTEASGTGNMKFALNGALTLGTFDGANIEIAEAVGAENIFIFGHTVTEIETLRRNGYNPGSWIEQNPRLKQVLQAIDSDLFSPAEPGIFRPLTALITQAGDHYCLAADFGSYVERHAEIADVWKSPSEWTRRSIMNTARMGQFSSDETIRAYIRDIWKVRPLPVCIDDVDRT